MNIGIFTDSYYPQISGVVTSTMMLKKELESLGHNVTVITVKHPDVDIDNSNIIRLPSIPFLPFPEQRIGAMYSHKIMNKIKNLNLDIIHTQTEFSIGIFGRISAKKLNIPVVHTYHTMYEDYVHYISKKTMKNKIKILVKKGSLLYCKDCNAVIVPSIKVKKVLMSYGLDNSNINVIPTGIDLEPFKKENYDTSSLISLKNSLGISENDIVVLYIGRVASEKSIDVIIKSMPYLIKKVPNAKLLIVGDGPEKENLQQLVKNIKIKNSVIFAGEKPWNEIGMYYQLGNVFVSASITETQGLTFSEAIASKVPIIAKYDRNLDGIITDKITGRIFKNDNELSDILFDVITNTHTTSAMVNSAYKNIESLSSKHFGESVEKLYMEVIENYIHNRAKHEYIKAH